jgi:hypothetical protein
MAQAHINLGGIFSRVGALLSEESSGPYEAIFHPQNILAREERETARQEQVKQEAVMLKLFEPHRPAMDQALVNQDHDSVFKITRQYVDDAQKAGRTFEEAFTWGNQLAGLYTQQIDANIKKGFDINKPETVSNLQQILKPEQLGALAQNVQGALGQAQQTRHEGELQPGRVEMQGAQIEGERAQTERQRWEVEHGRTMEPYEIAESRQRTATGQAQAALAGRRGYGDSGKGQLTLNNYLTLQGQHDERMRNLALAVKDKGNAKNYLKALEGVDYPTEEAALESIFASGREYQRTLNRAAVAHGLEPRTHITGTKIVVPKEEPLFGGVTTTTTRLPVEEEEEPQMPGVVAGGSTASLERPPRIRHEPVVVSERRQPLVPVEPPPVAAAAPEPAREPVAPAEAPTNLRAISNLRGVTGAPLTRQPTLDELFAGLDVEAPKYQPVARLRKQERKQARRKRYEGMTDEAIAAAEELIRQSREDYAAGKY